MTINLANQKKNNNNNSVLLGCIAVNRREAHWGGQLANPLMRILLCKVCITKMHGTI